MYVKDKNVRKPISMNILQINDDRYCIRYVEKMCDNRPPNIAAGQIV